MTPLLRRVNAAPSLKSASPLDTTTTPCIIPRFSLTRVGVPVKVAPALYSNIRFLISPFTR